MQQQPTLTAETPIKELELSVRAYNCLVLHSGIKTVGELAGKSDIELLRIKNFGRKSLREVRELLELYKPEPIDLPPSSPQASSSCAQLLATLNPREEKIIRLRYAIGCEREHKLQEIAEEFGITRERIRQILVRGMRRLRRQVGKNGVPADIPANMRVHGLVIPTAEEVEAANALSKESDLCGTGEPETQMKKWLNLRKRPSGHSGTVIQFIPVDAVIGVSAHQTCDGVVESLDLDYGESKCCSLVDHNLVQDAIEALGLGKALGVMTPPSPMPSDEADARRYRALKRLFEENKSLRILQTTSGVYFYTGKTAGFKLAEGVDIDNALDKQPWHW